MKYYYSAKKELSMFGREKEIIELEKLKNANKTKFHAIYGRRRRDKTRQCSPNLLKK